MSDTAHIFKAGDASLGHRVSEFLSALENYSRVQRSQQFRNVLDWSDRLGSAEDIDAAEAILKNSLQQASSAIKAEEMPEAIAKGYLDDAEASEFAKLRQAQDFQAAGQKPQSSGQKQSWASSIKFLRLNRLVGKTEYNSCHELYAHIFQIFVFMNTPSGIETDLRQAIEKISWQSDIAGAVAREALDHGEALSFFRDLLEHGCVSGIVSSLIYYCDTHAFFDRHYEEIEALREEYEHDQGAPLVLWGDLKNSLAWFAFELVAYRLASDLEII